MTNNNPTSSTNPVARLLFAVAASMLSITGACGGFALLRSWTYFTQHLDVSSQTRLLLHIPVSALLWVTVDVLAVTAVCSAVYSLYAGFCLARNWVRRSRIGG